MNQINLLSSKVYNRISAGEVVERPASIVKELVENSIDAGAKNITISVSGGGKNTICIIDDGEGIAKSQLKKALLPHATSKIKEASDLDNIHTLGFRGEALASISAVSKVEIISKPLEQQFGAKIYCEGGTIFDVEDSPCEKGTQITVNNIFYNTPAREKFLKSDKIEENEITLTVARFILGNPEIAFTYEADNELIYSSYGDGLESAFVCVNGVNAIKESYYINRSKNGISIKGYISKIQYSKGTRSAQTTFLNGRYIVNQTINSAIMNAYSPYLMKRRYPYYVLHISMPNDAVDCNTHPNKIDVRFINNQIVYGAIYSCISKVLDGSFEALDIVVAEEINTYKPKYVHNTFSSDKDVKYRYPKEIKPLDKIVLGDSVLDNQDKKEDCNKQVADIFAENKAYIESLEKKKQELLAQESIPVERPLLYIGQALNTYLIYEDGLDLYLIDQHAGHERVLFDKLSKSMDENNIEIQPLLLPFVATYSPAEFAFLKENFEIINSLGIDIVEFGTNTIKVLSVPLCLSNINLKGFFNDILSDLSSLKSISLSSLLKDKIAQKACKSAIKAGDKLSKTDTECLLESLKGNMGLKCPHGRPIAVKITKTEIEKWFKRIL